MWSIKLVILIVHVHVQVESIRIIKRMKDSESVYRLEEKTKGYYLCSVRVCSYLSREKGQGILIMHQH